MGQPLNKKMAMKIFISLSGERSKEITEFLKNWIIK